MSFDIAQQEMEAAKRLQESRRALDTLKREEDQYLKDRESKAQSMLAGLFKKAEAAEKILTELTQHIGKQAKLHAERFREFASRLVSLLDRAGKIMDQANAIQARAEETLEIYKKMNADLSAKSAELSALEKQVKSREREVERRGKEADDKLRKAEELAYWHKTGKRYNGK